MSGILEKYTSLVAQGWTPAVEVPVTALPVPGTTGSFFSYILTTGVTVTIYDHPDTGTFEVHGAILAHYLLIGGPHRLGFPISDEIDDVVGGQVIGRVSHFLHGSVFFNFADGSVFEIDVVQSPSADFEIVDGVDVSFAQGSIDWNKVANAGIRFAYIKATEGDTITDTQFVSNWTNSQGRVERGAYHFFHARSTPDATRTQADHFVNVIAATGLAADLPPVADVESLPSGITVPQAVASLQFFLSIVAQSTGRQPIIYTYPHFWKHTMQGSSAFASGFKLWIASYGNALGGGAFGTRPRGPLLPTGWTDWAMWQHAINRDVPGIGTLVDRNMVLVPAGQTLSQYLG